MAGSLQSAELWHKPPRKYINLQMSSICSCGTLEAQQLTYPRSLARGWHGHALRRRVLRQDGTMDVTLLTSSDGFAPVPSGGQCCRAVGVDVVGGREAEEGHTSSQIPRREKWLIGWLAQMMIAVKEKGNYVLTSQKIGTMQRAMH